eukprot:7034389-Alexandrium_andersonii.AAC.1
MCVHKPCGWEHMVNPSKTSQHLGQDTGRLITSPVSNEAGRNRLGEGLPSLLKAHTAWSVA